MRCRPTCAAVPDTRTSCAPCAPPRWRWGDDATRAAVGRATTATPGARPGPRRRPSRHAARGWPARSRARPVRRRRELPAAIGHAHRAFAQVAHGRLLSIDIAEALALPGVVAVWTGADVCGHPADPVPRDQGARARALLPADPGAGTGCAMPANRSPRSSPRMPMSPRTRRTWSWPRSTRCRSCSTPRQDPERIPARPSAPNRPSSARNMAMSMRHFAPRTPSSSSICRSAGIRGVPLETRGAIARYDAARDVLELHGTAKKQHWNRDEIARLLGRPPHGVHLFEGHVGGGFGVRGELYPEDLLVCLGRAAPGPPGQMDRGSPRASGGDQPFAPAAPPHPRGRRCGRPAAGDRRCLLPRPGRLCAHPRRAGRGHVRPACCPGPIGCRPIGSPVISA